MEITKKFYTNPYFYVIAILILCLAGGAIFHKCQVDSIRDNEQKLLNQLLADSNWQAKRIDETLSAIRTVQTNSISADVLTEKIKEQLDQYNLDAIYAASIDMQAKLNTVITGQSQNTQYIPNPNTGTTSGTTTLVPHNSTGENNANSNGQHNNSSTNSGDICGNTVPGQGSGGQGLEQACNTCLANGSIRVPFDATQQTLHIVGYTDTGPTIGSPGTYSLNVEWVKDINLHIALTQDEDGNWQSFIDSGDADINVMRIRSEVNISPYEQHWWENIQLGLGSSFGAEGVLFHGLAGYRITENVNLLGAFTYDLSFDRDNSDYNMHAYYGIQALFNL